MKYMLDTNICIYAIKQEPEVVLQKILKHHPSDICISSITYAELMHGVEKSQAKDKNRLALTLLLSPIKIVNFDSHAAEEYGKIKADLQSQGKIIGPMDLLIASHAKSKGLTIVTNNTKEFKRVNHLNVEDWSKPLS